MSSLKFGTSGLRGLVVELEDTVCFAYTVAFLKHMMQSHGIQNDGLVLVGYDLRDSSPRIANACMAAISSLGMRIENCGPLPTPGLALHAQTLGVPAIMVTGSHIPSDRNGLKFYRADGEIDKADEAGILAHYDLNAAIDGVALDYATNDAATKHYFKRCAELLTANALTGMRIGVYQHSSVARDLMVALVEHYGAEAITLHRSNVFVPVDTEALREEDIALARAAAREHHLDALISTDGDADRPLVADENGLFFRGDIVGLLTAHFLNADCAVTPVTSTTIIETSALFSNVVRTRVGSPYVIEGMAKAVTAGAKTVVGFEANGGVLLGTDVGTTTGVLSALPTRDAMLPILCVLGLVASKGVALSRLCDALPARFTQSGRLEHVEQNVTAGLLSRLQTIEFRNAFFAPVGKVAQQDAIDGVRSVFENGEMVHYRASGNAPELRCYVEADSLARAQQLLAWGLNAAQAAII